MTVATGAAPPAADVPGVVARVGAGVAGGLAGGVVFGILMQVTGVIPMVAQLIGYDSMLVGWAVHMAIAAVVGVTYALLFGWFAVVMSISTLMGTFYGLVWWVLGGLTLMPLRLGMGLFVFDSAAWQSLVGHVAYGLVLGAAYPLLADLFGGLRARGRHAVRGSSPPPVTDPAWRARIDHRLAALPEPGRRPSGVRPLSAETRSLRTRHYRGSP